jgi:hypothetical protein
VGGVVGVVVGGRVDVGAVLAPSDAGFPASCVRAAWVVVRAGAVVPAGAARAAEWDSGGVAEMAPDALALAGTWARTRFVWWRMTADRPSPCLVARCEAAAPGWDRRSAAAAPPARSTATSATSQAPRPLLPRCATFG